MNTATLVAAGLPPDYIAEQGPSTMEKVIVRSGIRTHASRGDCDLNAAP